MWRGFSETNSSKLAGLIVIIVIHIYPIFETQQEWDFLTSSIPLSSLVSSAVKLENSDFEWNLKHDSQISTYRFPVPIPWFGLKPSERWSGRKFPHCRISPAFSWSTKVDRREFRRNFLRLIFKCLCRFTKHLKHQQNSNRVCRCQSETIYQPPCPTSCTRFPAPRGV